MQRDVVEMSSGDVDYGRIMGLIVGLVQVRTQTQ